MLLLQVHYLLPLTAGLTAPALREEGYLDTSGVVLSLLTELRPTNAWSFEFMDRNMAVPTEARGYEYRSVCPPAALTQILEADYAVAVNGSITLHHIHAHAHHHAVRVSLHRTCPEVRRRSCLRLLRTAATAHASTSMRYLVSQRCARAMASSSAACTRTTRAPRSAMACPPPKRCAGRF